MPIRKTQQIFAQPVAGTPGLADKLLDLIGNIPPSRESASDEPKARARVVARTAATKAASAAGALALPPGPLGWLTIAPELYAVWKIQAQMVADIAGVYGKDKALNREQMLYCLFSHTAAKAFSDLVIRVGQRFVVRRAPVSALYAIANKVAIRIAHRSAGRVVARWVPALGALGVAGYVYFDTGRVADACIELFAADLQLEVEPSVESDDEMTADPKQARKSPRKADADQPAAASRAKRPAAAKVSARSKPARADARPPASKIVKKAAKRAPKTAPNG
ncbi:MAG: hypothetical protein ACT4NL_03340 [Pseudomarimonas sp.]